jgi:glyoxalase family protein
MNILGIHHVTVIAGDAQENIDFFVKILGLRFVKKTINFDDPSVYHLYYGDNLATPGTLMTSFPYGGNVLPGKRGTGEASCYTFEIPVGSMAFWADRLESFQLEHGFETIFGKKVLWVTDPDGARVEFEEYEDGSDFAFWHDSPVDETMAIRTIRRVTFSPNSDSQTEKVLAEVMEFSSIARSGNRERFAIGRSFVDVIRDDSPVHRSSAGTIHHVAFGTENDEAQTKWLKRLEQNNLRSSGLIDRDYFRSIYFREPGGILFELATMGPGFFIDEPADSLGTKLMLPAQYEHLRAEIESALPKLNLPNLK